MRADRSAITPFSFSAPVFALALCLTIITTSVWCEEDAQAELLGIWAQGHGGYTTGAGADVFGAGGFGQYGFAVGAEVLYVDLFMDIRLQEGTEGGTWNQLGLGFDFDLYSGDTFVPWLGFRAGYVYAQFTDAAKREYLAQGNSNPDPENKGINISAQIGLDIRLVGPLYIGTFADIGYHLLLPDIGEEMGINFHIMGALKVDIELL